MTLETSSVASSCKQDASVDQYVNAISDADIRLLRIFCIVVASGGLSAATTELQADLSTVSRHIKDLEDKVGARLCNRGRSGFSLTAHGVLVHSAAQELFRALKSFSRNITTLHDDPIGELKLGVMDALLTDPQFALPAALRAYRLKAPRVQVRLTVTRPNDIERLVLNGDLDAGIVAARDRPPGLDYHLLYHEKSSLYCASTHPFFGRSDSDIDLDDARARPGGRPIYRKPALARLCRRPAQGRQRRQHRSGGAAGRQRRLRRLPARSLRGDAASWHTPAPDSSRDLFIRTGHRTGMAQWSAQSLRQRPVRTSWPAADLMTWAAALDVLSAQASTSRSFLARSSRR